MTATATARQQQCGAEPQPATLGPPSIASTALPSNYARLFVDFNDGVRLLLLSKKVQMDKTARKVRNQDINPCIDESDASQKCLDAYNYDKNMCSAYFQRYKNCRKYWHNIMLQRRREGVKPDMPTAVERQEMLAAVGGKPY